MSYFLPVSCILHRWRRLPHGCVVGQENAGWTWDFAKIVSTSSVQPIRDLHPRKIIWRDILESTIAWIRCGIGRYSLEG